MDLAGVGRCVLVPLEPPGVDSTANNDASLRLAYMNPSRFAVMGRFDLRHTHQARLLPTWKAGHMVGVRVSFTREPNRSLLVGGHLDWFWTAAEEARLPVMLMVPGLIQSVEEVARKHPDLPMALDHMALTPHVIQDDIGFQLRALLPLARYPNVALKASALPCSIADPFPFESLREPVSELIDAFGSDRVFWGSDLTRLTCSYSEWIRFFTEELTSLSTWDLENVMGRAILSWLNWPE